MNKYPTFSPNACNPVSTSACQCDFGDDDPLHGKCKPVYGKSVCIVAGDAGAELKVHLRTVPCKEGHSEEDPSTWKPLNIAGFKWITMYIRDTATHEHHATLHGYPISPMRGGNVVFRIRPGLFDCVSGEYEGEVEIEYNDGRIVTAVELMLFEIREDFSGHGAAESHPDCREKPDHLPSEPGIQHLPFYPDMPTQLPAMTRAQIADWRSR